MKSIVNAKEFYTVLQAVFINEHDRMVELPLSEGAKANVEVQIHNTPLQAAALNSFNGVVRNSLGISVCAGVDIGRYL